MTTPKVNPIKRIPDRVSPTRVNNPNNILSSALERLQEFNQVILLSLVQI